MPPSKRIKSETIDVEEWRNQRRDQTRTQRRRRGATVINISDDSNDEVQIAGGSRSAPAEPRTTLRPEILERGRARSATQAHSSPPRNYSLGVVELTRDEYIQERNKRIKLTDNDEDNYEEYHAGYDIDNPSCWKPPVQQGNRIVQPESAMASHVPFGMSGLPRRLYGNGRPVAPTLRGNALNLPWNGFQSSARPSAMAHQGHLPAPRQRYVSVFANMLGLGSFIPTVYAGCNNQTSGSVNKILQLNGQIVACSAAIAGDADISSEVRHDHQNIPGSLVTIRQGKVHYPCDSHERKISSDVVSPGSSPPEEFLKTYTVNDMALGQDGFHNIIASSGHDMCIRFWQAGGEDPAGLRLIKSIPYGHVPYDVSFRPGVGLLLSAAFSNGDIVLYSPLAENSITMTLAPDQPVGSMAWGSDSTSDLLFASSEPVDGQRGYHRAFDTKKGITLFTFDAQESGDALTVDPSGNNVVLITHCADGRHLLRLYDVRNRKKTLTSTVTLEPVMPAGAGQSGEINCLVYSPDGLYIAAARNDGATHVYDIRMLDRGPVSRFRHHQRSRMVSPSYGVVRAQWLETHRSRLALVTGGDDGDVRLWDPLQSDNNPENGQVLAHSDWDIAHFVVGDVSQNEKPLIVGDSGGRITVYDSPATSLP
ncbi:hypothetical protein AB1N83_010068 [Pleurotus pulmonarius]